jgi:hypothetical protein
VVEFNTTSILRPSPPLGQTGNDDDPFNGSMAAIRVPLFKTTMNLKSGAPQVLEASCNIGPYLAFTR